MADDMADDMDLDGPSKSPPGESQRSTRATSVDMVDADLPSLDQQVAKVMSMASAPLQERQEGYIVSHKWLARVWARTSEYSDRPQEFSKEATQGPIGPVDNSGLVDADALGDDLMDQGGEDFIPLSKALLLSHDYEILPAKAWELINNWYGLKEGTPVIRRYAHNTVPDKSSEQIAYELHPPVLTIRKVRRAPASATETARPAVKIVGSRYESFLAFLEAAKKAAGIDLKNKVRIWRLLNSAPTDVPTQPSGMLTPDASPRDGSPVATLPPRASLVMDVASFNSLANGIERELVTGKDEKANEDSNESLTLEGASLTQDQIIILEEHDEQGEYISDTVKAAPKESSGVQVSKSSQSTPNSGRSTPVGGVSTRSRARNGKVRGHVGLVNLGNTCYMNSALQCLRSVEELSMYFLSNKWKNEINHNNPIGNKGAVAKVYGSLLHSIYDVSAVSSFAPRNFKSVLSKANTLFSGYGQQDSQEFVSWLIDALHEDLNRVHEKPYRENPDSDDNTFRDPEAIKRLGQVYQANHKARNNSVAMDLFSGFYKNTMVCPNCDKVSITFDPYSQLTLQLPIEQTWAHTVTYIPLLGKGKPCLVEVDMDKNATIKALKEFVGKRFGGVPASRLMASEVYSNKFYRHLEDNVSIAEANIGQRDDIYVYELDNAPSNWPPPKKKGSRYRGIHASSDEEIPDNASPLHDRVLIPVFNRGPSSYRPSSHTLTLWPFFIVLTRDEAKDYDIILQKILARVAQMTTRDIFGELSDPIPGQSNPGSDVVLTTDEDALPNGEVKDGSIEGEDLVEVTMADSNGVFPKVLEPGAFIHAELRRLFEVKHTRKAKETVTTGWNTVDPNRPLEPISKRMPVPSTDVSENDEDSSEEDGITSQSMNASPKLPSIASSDEEMQSVEPEDTAATRGGRPKKKSKKALKKERRRERTLKGNKNFRSNKNRVSVQPSYSEDPDDDDDDSLIRMGEALVLEWPTDTFDALFGGNSVDDARGQDALKFIETLEDPEIGEKKARRAARKKHGITLDSCFSETAKSEVLSEDNAWYCGRCKELRRATKTLEIWSVPDILIIHLKRFSGTRSMRDKIDEFVNFPVKGLDLAGKVGYPDGKDLKYDLFAVDNHMGGLGGGHYTAYAQNFFDDQWYEYNDSTVGKCSSGERAVTRNAYLLFYRRRTPHPLGPPELQALVSTPLVSEDEDEDSGNGQRLDASSRNGSSSASTGTGAAAGAVALRGGGSQPLAGRGSHLKNAVGAEDDEGFVDEEEEDYSGAVTTSYNNDSPTWGWGHLPAAADAVNDEPNNSDDEVASNHANMADSVAGSAIEDRMMDFGDDEDGVLPSAGTVGAHPTSPIEGVSVGYDDDAEVHEINLV